MIALRRTAVWSVGLSFAFGISIAAARDKPSVTIGGEQPAYFTQPPSRVANAQALVARHWVPGLQEGFIPQGLAWHDGKVFVAGYTALVKGQDRGPCSVARIDAATGNFEYRFALPDDCGHAGGLAFGEGRTLYASDTRRLYIFTLNDRLEPEGPPRVIRLSGDLKGSFIAWQAADRSLWLGTYDRNSAARAWRFSAAQLADRPADPPLSEAQAGGSIMLPAKAQGAAFDAGNRLWVSQGGRGTGQLSRLDITTGNKLASFEVPPGIEGLSFDTSGKLWSVSEAGARKYIDWPVLFPLVFALDIEKLK